MESRDFLYEEIVEDELVTLLDVDETLIDTEAKYINLALIEVLQEADIKTLYLFTSMYSWQVISDLGPEHPQYTRQKLISELENTYGFKVQKTITPSDVFLKRAGAYYEECWKPVFTRWQKTRQEGVDVFHSSNKKILEQMDSEVKGIDAEVNEQESSLHTIYNKLMNEGRKEEAKQFMEQHRKDKGSMFRLVKKDIPAKSYLYFDDKIREIQSVEEENNQNPVVLTTVEVKTKGLDSSGDLPKPQESQSEYAMRKEEIKQRYRAKLIEHFKKMPEHEKTLKKLQKNYEEYEKLSQLVNDIRRIQSFYEKLEGKSLKHGHSEDIQRLLKQVDQIQQDFLLSTEAKSRRISEFLVGEYLTIRKKYENKSGFLGKKKPLIERLNTEQKDHHYARIIGLIINSEAISEKIINKHLNIRLEVSNIIIPDTEPYTCFSFARSREELTPEKNYKILF